MRIKMFRIVPAIVFAFTFIGCDAVGLTGPDTDLGATRLTSAAAKGGQGKGRKSDGSTSTLSDGLSSSVTILDRKVPLDAALSATAVIGPLGGEIWIREGGVELIVPRGALAENTRITVTALAGSKLAFDFQPHGLQFDVPVKIEIKSDLGVDSSNLLGVYFEGDPQTNPELLEFFKLIDLSRRWVELTTTHFSGYALASL